MKALLIFSLAAALASAARTCSMIGSGDIVVRSCPSLDCKDMGHYSAGHSDQYECYYESADGWYYSSGLKGYVRSPRLNSNCCPTCVPKCKVCWGSTDCCGSSCGGGCTGDSC